MKCFTVTTSAATSGIRINPNPYHHIPVGESGRGRKLVQVPLGRQDYPDGCESLTEVSLMKTDRGGAIVIKPVAGDKRALVLVDIPAGYRGGTSWSGVVTVKTPCKKRGQIICDNGCPSCGLKLAEYGMFHPDEGMAYDWPAFETAEGIKVVAEGECAQGDAGRMGGHTVRLLIMEPGSMFRVSRSGRLYGAPGKRYVRWTGTEMQVGTFDELFQDSIQEEAATGSLM